MTATRAEAQEQRNPPVALITGGRGAVGSVLVQEFRRAGYRVGIPLHRTAQPTSSDPDPETFTATADLSREEDVSSFVAQLVERFGRIDALLHAVGGYQGGNLVESTTMGEWSRMLEINLQTTFLAIRAVLPTMRAQAGGRIICLAAQAGLTPAPRKAAYGVSKRGVLALVEATAEELKGTGITCNALAPGTVLTSANLKAMPGADTSTWVRPEEIARLCLFLSSEAAGALNGCILPLHGRNR